MADLDAALATQLKNIEKRSGKTLAQIKTLLDGSGLVKHGEQRSWLMETLALGYGDANTVAQVLRKAEAPPAAADPLDDIYSGAKAALRPLHLKLMAEVERFGPFDLAPKKAYVSLRRKKQFAMIGPATKTQVEVGLNAKDLPSDARLKVKPPGGMCQYTVRLSSAEEVDKALIGWLRTAYDAAG